MASRLRLYDCRISQLPAAIGKCQQDAHEIAQYVNAAQRRLLMCKEAGDEGWWGTWAEVAFAIDPAKPIITLPREIARIEAINVCNRPVPLHNQFYEYLQFGNGRMPKRHIQCPGFINVFTRNTSVTFRDLTNAPQNIYVYLTDPADVGKRVMLSGLDANGRIIYTQDGVNRVTGVFVSLTSPFAVAPMTFSSFTGIQKDVTNGQVQFFQVDPTSGEQILLLTMEPGEQTASYRRYFLNPIPRNCCGLFVNACVAPNLPQMVLVTAIAKLELIPVTVDTDYCLIQNLEAIIEECQSIRYSRVDTPAAKAMAKQHHLDAIGFLNGELAHYLGITDPAINVAPFGGARLAGHNKIGTLI